MLIWITGAPGAGKTTTALKFQTRLPKSIVLDGDECRKWLTPDCDFTAAGRLKHATRLWQVAAEISAVGGAAICALVAPPPFKVDLLVLCQGRSNPLWPGTTYEPPIHPDIVIDTGDQP